MKKNYGAPMSPGSGGRVLRAPDPATAFGGGGTGTVNVKAPSARYSDKRWTGKHKRTGEEVFFGGKAVEMPSERDFALIGVLFKGLWRAKSKGEAAPLNEHEGELLKEVMNDSLWSGKVPGGQYVKGVKFGEFGVKADLLTDSGSGGLHVTPVFFDTAIISYPLLFGELFPFIDLIDVPASNRIATAALNNPTLTWGVSEGTPVTAFSATGLISAITADIESAKVAILVGNDLLSDAAIAIGTQLTAAIGQRFAQSLDEVIATGDGTNEPTGIFVGGGTTAVSSVNGTSGPLTIADAEQLAFAVPKQYRKAALNPCFIGSDASYRRFRAVPVGTGDQRRVFGMDHSSYTLLEHPFRVENSITEGSLAYGCLRKFRMWRRLGMSMRFTSEGQTLGLKDESMLFCKMRVGGKVVDPNAFAVMTDGPATG